MASNFRETKHRIIQRLLWNRAGWHALRFWLGLRRRIDYVALNYSLHNETNGEHWLLTLPPADALVLDVGYHSGEFTQAVLERIPGARVIAFDPARSARDRYQATHGADSRVTFEPLALSNANSTLSFNDYGNMSSSLAARRELAGEPVSTYDVPVVTLDSYMRIAGRGKIDFLKIDAEGFDLHVLEGATALLDEQMIDCFMFEYADGWISSRRFLRDAVAYLESKPYTLCRLYNGFLAPFQYHNRHERFDVGCMFVGVSQRWLETRRHLIRPAVF